MLGYQLGSSCLCTQCSYPLSISSLGEFLVFDSYSVKCIEHPMCFYACTSVVGQMVLLPLYRWENWGLGDSMPVWRTSSSLEHRRCLCFRIFPSLPCVFLSPFPTFLFLVQTRNEGERAEGTEASVSFETTDSQTRQSPDSVCMQDSTPESLNSSLWGQPWEYEFFFWDRVSL